MKVDFLELAKLVMFSATPHKDIVESKKLRFRKGKMAGDIQKALVMSRKKGHYKTEFELGMLELYLADVFMKRTA